MIGADNDDYALRSLEARLPVEDSVSALDDFRPNLPDTTASFPQQSVAIRYEDVSYSDMAHASFDIAHTPFEMDHPPFEMTQTPLDTTHPSFEVAHTPIEVAHPPSDMAHAPIEVDHPTFDVNDTLDVAHTSLDTPHTSLDTTHTSSSSSHDSGNPLHMISSAAELVDAASVLTLKNSEHQDVQFYPNYRAFSQLVVTNEHNSPHPLHFETELAPDKADQYPAGIEGQWNPPLMSQLISRYPHIILKYNFSITHPKLSVPYQYGTDDSFEGSFYSPPANQQSDTQYADTILNAIEIDEPGPSTTSTRPPSSMRNEYSHSDSVDIPSSSTSQSIVNELVDKDKDLGVQDCETLKRKKRKRGKTRGAYDDDDDDNDKNANHDDDNDDNDDGHVRAKRRKSSSCTILDTASPKEPRKNFTAEEKRLNHAGSEQKRRLGLTQCFDAITNLIPDLRDKKYTKSDRLQIAAQWLENLLAGNKELEAQIALLKS